jgi:hypothetical protein
MYNIIILLLIIHLFFLIDHCVFFLLKAVEGGN